MSRLSASQHLFARAVKQLMARDEVADPRLLSRSELNAACRSAYPQLERANSRVVASYVSANLKSSAFLWATGCPPTSKMVDLVKVREKLRILEGQLSRAMASIEAVLG